MAAKKVSIFDVFLANLPKRVTYLSTKSHGTLHPARSRYQDSKSSIGIEKCWKLTKWRPKMCRFLTFFGFFGQNGQNASLIYLSKLTALHIKLDQVTRILNLQSESKNVENWRNGGPKSVDFLRFFGKMAKRVTYLYSESHGTAYPARPSSQEPKSSIGFEKYWKLMKWRQWFFMFFGKSQKRVP